VTWFSSSVMSASNSLRSRFESAEEFLGNGQITADALVNVFASRLTFL
jgi:hypothetical protein